MIKICENLRIKFKEIENMEEYIRKNLGVSYCIFSSMRWKGTFWLSQNSKYTDQHVHTHSLKKAFYFSISSMNELDVMSHHHLHIGDVEVEPWFKVSSKRPEEPGIERATPGSVVLLSAVYLILSVYTCSESELKIREYLHEGPGGFDSGNYLVSGLGIHIQCI